MGAHSSLGRFEFPYNVFQYNDANSNLIRGVPTASDDNGFSHSLLPLPILQGPELEIQLRSGADSQRWL